MAPPPDDSDETVLKAGSKRTVVLQSGGAQGNRVTKRFHGHGFGGLPWLGAPGDWRRARGEHRALSRACTRGLPAPKPIAVARSKSGGWELSMEAVPGACPLTEVLDSIFAGARLDVARVQALATELGDLLRRVEAAGFVHADPHPGNILMGAGGVPWIVDVARSHLGASASSVEASILRALSRTRELTPRTFRRRLALAWLGPRATAEWTRRVESEATSLRIQEMRDRVAVWRRDSSATEVRTGQGKKSRVVHVRERSPMAPRGWMTRLESGTESEVHAIWDTLVRAKLHRLPGCEPRSVTLTAPFSVQFDMPANAGPPSQEAARITCHQLAIRGLSLEPRLEGDALLLAGADGIARISPLTRFVEVARQASSGAPP